MANEFILRSYTGCFVVPGFCPGTRPRLVVPKAVQEKVMAEMHSGPFGGHFAACGNYEKLARRYY